MPTRMYIEKDGLESGAEAGASELKAMLGERSMTDENADAWAMIAPIHQIQRLTDWANMLEKRVKELDPIYRAYPWGRKCSPTRTACSFAPFVEKV